MKFDFKEQIDSLYLGTGHFSKNAFSRLIPFVRRFIRFFALPYCMIYCVDWRECTKSKKEVFADLLYIFFVHKRFPDNYALCRLWEQNREDWKYYYGSIYDAYQRNRLQKKVQRPEYRVVFDDKEVCYGFCKSLNVPLPDQCAVISPEQDFRSIISKLLNESTIELIIKPVSGCGGKDVVRAYIDSSGEYVQSDDNVINLSQFEINERSVVQRRLKQHSLLSGFGNAFPTFRIETFLTPEGDVLILGAFIRFSIGSSIVDNICSGGIYVCVDLKAGCLKDEGYDFNRKRHSHHPDNNVEFAGFEIPCWSEVVLLAKTVQQGSSFYRFLGLDIGLTESGPVLIEINPSPDNNCLESACGPLLKDKAILDAFRKDNLLICPRLEMK